MEMRKCAAIKMVEEDFKSCPEVGEACVAIIDYLSCTPLEALSRITFGALFAAVGSEGSNALLAIQYLTGARVTLLEPVYYLSFDNDEAILLDASVIAESRAAEEFYHPETGALIPSFEKYIYLDFSLAKRNGHLVAEWVGEYA